MDNPKELGETEVDGKMIIKWIWIVSEPVVSNNTWKTEFLSTFVMLAIISHFLANSGTEAGKEQKRRNSLYNIVHTFCSSISPLDDRDESDAKMAAWWKRRINADTDASLCHHSENRKFFSSFRKLLQQRKESTWITATNWWVVLIFF